MPLAALVSITSPLAFAPSLSRAYSCPSPSILPSVIHRTKSLAEHQRLCITLPCVHDKIDMMYQRQTTKPLLLSESSDSNRHDTIIIARSPQLSHKNDPDFRATTACNRTKQYIDAFRTLSLYNQTLLLNKITQIIFVQF